MGSNPTPTALARFHHVDRPAVSTLMTIRPRVPTQRWKWDHPDCRRARPGPAPQCMRPCRAVRTGQTAAALSSRRRGDRPPRRRDHDGPARSRRSVGVLLCGGHPIGASGAPGCSRGRSRTSAVSTRRAAHPAGRRGGPVDAPTSRWPSRSRTPASPARCSTPAPWSSSTTCSRAWTPSCRSRNALAPEPSVPMTASVRRSGRYTGGLAAYGPVARPTGTRLPPPEGRRDSGVPARLRLFRGRSG